MDFLTAGRIAGRYAILLSMELDCRTSIISLVADAKQYDQRGNCAISFLLYDCFLELLSYLLHVWKHGDIPYMETWGVSTGEAAWLWLKPEKRHVALCGIIGGFIRI